MAPIWKHLTATKVINRQLSGSHPEEFAAKWQEFTKTGAVGDTTPPPPPTNLEITNDGNGRIVVRWQAIADFESGLAGFRVEQDERILAEIPEKPKPRFGRPLFQRMSYHDTPEQPLRMMEFVLPDDADASKPITVSSVNSVGIASQSKSVATPSSN